MKTRQIIVALMAVIGLSVGKAWGASVTLTLSDNSTDTWSNEGKSGGGTAIAMCDKTVTGITLSGTSGYCDTGNSYTRVYSGSTFTVASSVGNITQIVINARYKNSSGSIKDNNNTSKSLTSSFTNYTWNYSPGVSSVTFTSTSQNYIKYITVTYTATTTVTPSPTSITFAANTLSGGKAAGSSTINISVSNGYKSSGNYLNIWPETDETSCEFTVNSGSEIYSSGNSTSVSSLSVEYYAIEAGTFTGNLIAQGYNSSYQAVNCTIPLSITVSAPACANNVTINKGTSTNCSFTLSKSGAQASCDGVSTTVTVSPTSGYGNPSVTQTGASAAPTITGSSNTYTVAYGANTTGTSTINVSCSANTYTITLNKDLTPTTAGTASITATYNASTNLTSAITKPTKTGWTFGGYYTAQNGGGTQIIDASGNVIASVSGYTDASKNWKYAGNITLYAKWTCTVTWSVNGATDVYDAQTLTYNGTSTKVGSVPDPPSPASYCGQKFAGWTDAAIDGTQVAAPSTLFTTVAGSPELKTVGNKTFYAVFADYDD